MRRTSCFSLTMLLVALSGGCDEEKSGSDSGAAPGGSVRSSMGFRRMLAVVEWGGAFDSAEKLDRILADAAYMRADAIMLQVGSAYIEAARDPVNYGSWDGRASWDMLGTAISKAHDRGMQLHAWLSVNITGGIYRAEWRRFGTRFAIVNEQGGVPTAPPFRNDPAFQELADYEIGLLTFLARNYPSLDGIHIEEPFYGPRSYTTAMRTRIQARYGYDPLYPPATRTVTQVRADIDAEARVVFNGFFARIRAAVSVNKANPNLQLSANHWITNNPVYGFDGRTMAANGLLDWYASQTAADDIGEFRYEVGLVAQAITQIPVAAVAYITYSGISPNTNLNFFEQVRRAYEFGADMLIIFAQYYKDRVVEGGKTAKEGLHEIVPPPLPAGP